MVRHRKTKKEKEKKTEAQRIKKREAALRQRTETCCTQPQSQRAQIQVQQKGKYYKSRINNKLAIHSGGPVC